MNVTLYERFGKPATIVHNRAYIEWARRLSWTVKGRATVAVADSLIGKRCVMRGAGPYRTVSRQGKRDRVTLPAECVEVLKVRKLRRTE